MSSQGTSVPSVPAGVRKAIHSQLSSVITSYTANCEGYIMKPDQANNYSPTMESPREGALSARPVQSGDQLSRQPLSSRVKLPYSKSFLKRHNASTES